MRGVAVDLPRDRRVQHHRRDAGGDGVERRQAEALVRGQKGERRRPTVQLGQLGVGDVAAHGDALLQAGGAHVRADVHGRHAARVADDRQVHVGAPPGQAREPVHQLEHVPPGQDRSDVEDQAAGGRERGRQPRVARPDGPE